MIRFCTQVLIITFLVSAAHAQSAKHLWVLQEQNKIIEYDVASFTAKCTVKVPPRLLEAPKYLSINSKGMMLFLPPHGVHWVSGEMASAGHRAWFWDGHRVKEWNLEGVLTRGDSGGKPAQTETIQQCFLSVGGEHLIWFENKFEYVTFETDKEQSVRSTGRVWRTDLTGGRPEAIISFPSTEWCRCETGACSETCSQWNFRVPDGVVDDFFFVTRFTPGQLGATYHESLLYQHSAPTWKVKKLPQPVERHLTASEKGEVLVTAVPDEGCCGWRNAGNNLTLLQWNGKTSVLFDEFERYNNRNYDVSFFTSDACIAPGKATVAYTIVSSAQAGKEIRLVPDGKENTQELARIRGAIAELPAVELVRPGSEAQPKTTIPHASLVGWMSEHEIIMVQDGRLVVFDIHSNKRRETTIRVRSAADAFLR